MNVVKWIVIFLFIASQSYTQIYAEVTLDNYKAHLSSIEKKSVKVDSALSLVKNLMYDKNELAKQIGKLSITISIEENYRLAEFYNALGDVFYLGNNIDSSLYYYTEGKRISSNQNNKKQLAESLAGIGMCYESKDNYHSAIQYYIKSFTIREEINDTTGLASILNNIGLTYYAIEDFEKAAEYLKKCCYYDSLTNNKSGLGYSYSNIGMIYYQLDEYDKATQFLKKSLAIRTELGQKLKMAATCNNLGNVYSDNNNIEEAIKYYEKALKIKRDLGNEVEVGITLNNLGKVKSFNLGKHEPALQYLKEAAYIFLKYNDLEHLRENYYYQNNVFYKLKKIDSAYYYFNKSIILRDSVQNQKKSELIASLTAQFESEKKEKQIEIQELKLKEQHSKLEKQTLKQKWMTSIILITFITLVVIAYAFVQKRKDNKLLAKQKDVIQEKNEELNQTNEEILAISETIEEQNLKLSKQNNHIVSSIEYAKRIQEAILPKTEKLKSLLKNAAVLYKAKDIVSGDFYWVEKVENQILWAAVDCTGHGVPGAFMSILGHNGLNKIVREDGITKPNEILTKLSNQIINALHETNTGEELKDGMDIALCSINLNTLELQYSGAYNPLYLLRNNTIHITKATKRPIGFTDRKKNVNFVNHTIKLQKNDRVYIFTDGIADQFGGENAKKYGYNRLRDFLVETQNINIQKQLDELENNLTNWMIVGNEEQLDDICIIGIHI